MRHRRRRGPITRATAGNRLSPVVSMRPARRAARSGRVLAQRFDQSKPSAKIASPPFPTCIVTAIATGFVAERPGEAHMLPR